MANRNQFRDGRAETIVSLQNKMADLKAEIARLRKLPTWREGVEAAAAVVDAERARALATQYSDAKPGSFEDDVNRQTRMVTVLLPNVSEKIRALKPKEPI